MGSTMTQAERLALLRRSEIAPAMANADLRKPEIVDYRVLLGAVLERARLLAGWSLKELANHLPLEDGTERDERQVAKWINGIERAHWDVLFACLTLQQPLIIALAELVGDAVEIETIVRVRRRQ